MEHVTAHVTAQVMGVHVTELQMHVTQMLMHVTASTPPAMAGKCIRIRKGQVQRARAAPERPGRSAVRGRNSPSHGSPTRSHHRPRHLFIASHTIILRCVGMQRVRVLYWGCPCVLFWGCLCVLFWAGQQCVLFSGGCPCACAMASVRIVLDRQRRHARVVATTRRPETTPQDPRALAQTGRPARLLLLDRARLRPRLGIRHAAWRRCLLHYTPKR